MELKDIQKHAQETAGDIQIDWEQLDSNPAYVQDMETVLQRAVKFLPQLETLYNKVSQGKSALFDGEESALTYEMREEYLVVLEQELFAAYQLKDVYERFTLIRSITELDNV